MDALDLVGSSVIAFTASVLCVLLLRPLVYRLDLIDRRSGHKTRQGEVAFVTSERLRAFMGDLRAILVIYLTFSVVMSFLGLLGFRLGTSDHLMFLGFIASFLMWQVFVRSAFHVVLLLPHYFQQRLHLRGV